MYGHFRARQLSGVHGTSLTAGGTPGNRGGPLDFTPSIAPPKLTLKSPHSRRGIVVMARTIERAESKGARIEGG